MSQRIRKCWNVNEPISTEANSALDAYPKILRQLFYNRGIEDALSAKRYLFDSGSIFDPYLLADMGVAVERLLHAVDQKEQIAVYGDYDVDGVTATALMVQVLSRMGADVRAYIPNRFEEGYGLNNDAVDSLSNDGIGLILTVDCGIRSPYEVEHARKLDMDIIISDHHEPKEKLPSACAVICPKRLDDKYPNKNLAGVGLAYKISEALLDKRPIEGTQPEEWLDLVAIGTVADIVPLIGENRSLVRAGLMELQKGQRQGLRSLAGAAGLEISRITARDIGFIIGPRINAAGRLKSAVNAYKLLMTKEVFEAGKLAQHLDDQNSERQKITRQIQEEAERQALIEEPDYLLFAVDPEFNLGVVGLAASRLTEAYYRPSIIGNSGEEFTCASCRSIPEFNVIRALDECADFFERHGGHAMAAGFTMRTERLPELVKRLREICKRELEGCNLRPQVWADMEIPLAEIRPVGLLRMIDQIEPTGHLNPGVNFISRGLKVKRYRQVGNEGLHLRLTVIDSLVTYDAIAFRQGHWAEQMPDYVDLFYSFERNHYQGRERLQLNVHDLVPAKQMNKITTENRYRKKPSR